MQNKTKTNLLVWLGLILGLLFLGSFVLYGWNLVHSNPEPYTQVSMEPTDFTLVNLNDQYAAEIPNTFMHNGMGPFSTTQPRFYFETNSSGEYFWIRINPYIVSIANPVSANSPGNNPCSISADLQAAYCYGLVLKDSFTPTSGMKTFYAVNAHRIHTNGETFFGPSGNPETYYQYDYVFAVPDKTNGHIVEFFVSRSEAGNFQGIAGDLRNVTIPSLQPMTPDLRSKAAMPPTS